MKKNPLFSHRWAGLVVIALPLILNGCSTYKMGEAATVMDKLTEAIDKCRADGLAVHDVNPKALPKPDQATGRCQTTSSGLAVFSNEMAKQAKAIDESVANSVFYYRLAALSAWLTDDPSVSQNVYDYSAKGRELCASSSEDKTQGIQQGDCALFEYIDSFAQHDENAKKFINLKKTAGTPKPYFDVDPTDKKKTVIEEIATRIHEDGMRALAIAIQDICRIKPHNSTIKAMGVQYNQMHQNLSAIFATGTTTLSIHYKKLPMQLDAKKQCVGTAVKPDFLMPGKLTIRQKSVLVMQCLAKNSATAAQAIKC